MTLEQLIAERRRRWCQDGVHRVPDADAAREFIDRLGVVTVYAASPEVPNLLHAYVSDPDYKSEPSHDSPGGDVYTWRWSLGRQEAAWYGLWVAKKPTYVAWPLLPAVLGAVMERRDPEEMYRAGELSQDAYRIAAALRGADGSLSTAELRTAAGYPTGKEHRAAYLKGLEELELAMWVAKTFRGEGEMCHAWVGNAYPDAVSASREMRPEAAVAMIARHLLPAYGFIEPKVLARHLRLPETVLAQALSEVGEEMTLEKRRLFVAR